ncbi:hypothetical protein [Arsenicicoccus dermatophilus]|uniref:hypothetical protein n=1 Tax=Arsenicicoccus dermatophilus TaxID=1076331 RepID=UPI003916CEEA
MTRKQIRFPNQRYNPTWWWNVQGEDDRWLIATHQAPFMPKGTVTYTILDKQEKHRGPTNLIGQGWGDSRPWTDEHTSTLLDALRRGALPEPLPGYYGVVIEISHRNRVPALEWETREVPS